MSENKIDRRTFLKLLGGSTAITTATALAGCDTDSQKRNETNQNEISADKMTYRTNPSTRDKISILGYGCMRWPTITNSSARDNNDEIDQNMVNELVDFAISHGVNYFDTSPAYCKGRSERATGIALHRHPREKYFIATKLSNFAPGTWDRKTSIAMYHNSLKELQVDYIDYMLLHGVGMGNGMEEFEARYINNGVLDFLLEERRAGRIRNLGFSYHGDIKVFDYLLSRHHNYKWDFVQIQLNYLDWKHAKEINERNDQCGILIQRTKQKGNSGHYHGTPAGRTSLKSTRSHSRPPETTGTGTQYSLMGFSVRRLFPRRIDGTQRNDLYGTSARQSPHLHAITAFDRRRNTISIQDCRSYDAISHYPL